MVLNQVNWWGGHMQSEWDWQDSGGVVEFLKLVMREWAWIWNHGNPAVFGNTI